MQKTSLHKCKGTHSLGAVDVRATLYLAKHSLGGIMKGVQRCIIKSQSLKGDIYFKEPNPQ